jgi:hypothetical protein
VRLAHRFADPAQAAELFFNRFGREARSSKADALAFDVGNVLCLHGPAAVLLRVCLDVRWGSRSRHNLFRLRLHVGQAVVAVQSPERGPFNLINS